MYIYKLVYKNGKVSKIHSYEEPEVLASVLEEKGYFILDVESRGKSILSKPMSNTDLYLFSSNLSFLLEAGLELTESLEILKTSLENKRIEASIESILRNIYRGDSFSRALKKEDGLYPDFLIDLVLAAEETGQLSLSLKKAASYYRQEDRLRKEISRALAYPSLVLLSSVVLIIFLSSMILPQFENIYRANSMELPWPTKILLGLNTFVSKNLKLIITIILFFLLALKLNNMKEDIRLKDRVSFKLPIVRNISSYYYINLLTASLSTLLKSGLALTDALVLVENIIGNKIVKKEVLELRINIERGGDLEKLVNKEGCLPISFKKIFKMAMDSGNLISILDNIQSYSMEKLEAALRDSIDKLEPIMLFIMAFIIGFIMISMSLPMFRLVDVIN